MARPNKYDWDAIQEAFENGIDKDTIVKKYKIAKNILTNKINNCGWIVKCDINNDIIEFSEKLNSKTQNSFNPVMQEIIQEKLNTQLQDNQIMQNNRDLALMLQNVITNSRHDIDLKNIKSVSSTLKDLESIANPKPDVQVSNNTEVKVLKVEFV